MTFSLHANRRLRGVAILALSLAFASGGDALAKGMSGRFSSPRSTSSPKASPAVKATATAKAAPTGSDSNTKTGFGTFGAAKATDGSAARVAPSTAMSRDLTTGAAKASALKTLDGRTAATANAAAATRGADASLGSGYSNNSMTGSSSGYAGIPAAPPVIIYQGAQRNTGDRISDGITGWAIGNMLFGHNHQGNVGTISPSSPLSDLGSASPAAPTSSSLSFGFGSFLIVLLATAVGAAGVWFLFFRSPSGASSPPVAPKKNYTL